MGTGIMLKKLVQGRTLRPRRRPRQTIPALSPRRSCLSFPYRIPSIQLRTIPGIGNSRGKPGQAETGEDSASPRGRVNPV